MLNIKLGTINGIAMLLAAGISSTALASEKETAQANQDRFIEYIKESESAAPGVPYESIDKDNLPEHKARWSDFLPIFGKEAREQGYILPLPFGVSLIGLTQQQPFKVERIGIAINDKESDFINGIVDDVVSAENLIVSDTTFNLRLDAWIFPFWNIYGLAGYTDGSTELDIRFQSDTVLNIPAVGGAFTGPAFCTGLGLSYDGTTDPQSCLIDLRATGVAPVKLNFHGTVLGYGTTIAGGIGNFFGMFDVNYSEADINIAKNRTEQTVYSARLGWNGSAGIWTGQIWVGGMQQDIKQTLFIEVPGVPIDAIIDQKVRSPSNYLVGGAWNFSPEWQLIMESSFLLSDRQQFLMQLSYRM